MPRPYGAPRSATERSCSTRRRWLASADVEIVSSSPEETEAVGAALARELAPGDVVTVAGELGAGKTTLVRGACRALGVTDRVTSPTFTIGHRYRGAVDVSHLDLYRFERVSPEEWGDLEPYFRDAIVFVEWPEAAGGELPPAPPESVAAPVLALAAAQPQQVQLGLF